MELLNLVQGTPEWHEKRLKSFTASEAPIMMGASRYMTREELLSMKKTGVQPEVNEHTQRIFDAGHEVEELARPVAQTILGEELFPVTGFKEVEGLPLLASFDGLNMLGDKGWEHKQWNKEKAAVIASLEKASDLDPFYYWQLEQQLLVSDADSIFFMMSDGTEDKIASITYVSIPERRAKLIAAWKLFQEDLAGHEIKEYSPEAVAAVVRDLPTITYNMNGLELSSNLAQYKEAALQLVEDSRKKLVTDQDFADAESRCKVFKEATKTLKLMKEQVIGEIISVDEFCKDIEFMIDSLNTARLSSEKQIKSRKDDIRKEIVTSNQEKLTSHIADINNALEGVQLPYIAADFAGAIKGKKKIQSLHEAASDELARAKIEANQYRDHILVNLAFFDQNASKHKFLFSDLQQIVMKEAEDFCNVIEVRIAKHEAQEAAKHAQVEEKKANEALDARKPELAPETVQAVAAPLKSVKKEITAPEQIKEYLYQHFALNKGQVADITEALITGRVPHMKYVSDLANVA